MVYTRHGIITALFVASACTAEPHPLAQALLHRGGIHVGVTGEGLDDFIAGTGIQLVPEGTYYVEAVDTADEAVRARQSPHEAYAFDVRIEDWILWRYRDKAPYSEVAIDRDSVEPDWPEGQGIGPVHTLGWVPATGQWMGEVLIHLEDQAPWDICVELTRPDNETLDGGQLLNGRIGYYPGTAGQVPLRHRMYFQGVDVKAGYSIVLTDCSSGLVLDTRPLIEWNHIEPKPMPELQQIWTDVRPAQGEWMIPKGGATGLRKTIDGMVRVDGPPYPRLRKKEAWPVLFVGAVDPTHWDMPTVDTSLAPLRRADPWLDGPGMTVLGLGALPTRHGPPAILGGKKGTKERRIVPEWLPVIKRHGVDAISFSGPVRSQFSLQTIQRAEDNIRALGLSAVTATALTPTIFSYDVSDNQYTGALLSVQVPHESTDAFWSELRGVLTQLVQSTHSVLLDITVNEATTVEERLQHLSIEGVAGIVVIGGAAKPGVHIYNGVTHVYGLRELGMDHRLGLAVRWYLGAYGLQRIDLIGVGINSDGQLIRASEHESKGMFDALARNSVRFGTYVRPGKQIATVDVRGHVSHRKRDVGEAVIPTPTISVGFEEKTLPERCVGTAVKNPKVSYDSGLRLDSWTLLKSTVKQGSPFVLELQWSVANASSMRPDTRIRLNAPFRPEPLRHQYQPCSGSWSLNDLSPRQVLREQIRFWPPESIVEDEAELWVTIRDASGVLRTVEGDRRVSLGKIRIEK